MAQPLIDTTDRLLADYLRLLRARTGQQMPQTAPTTRWGLSPDQAERLFGAIQQPTPQPAPPRKGDIFSRIVEPVGERVGFYVTQLVPAAAESLFGSIIEPAIGSLYGEGALREYQEARKVAALDFKKARSEQGLLRSIDDWARGLADVRKKRPGLFPGEKLIAELIVDPTTWMGWGLFRTSGLLGRLGLSRVPLVQRPLQAFFETAPHAAADFFVYKPARLLRKGVEGTAGALRFASPFARSAEAQAADEAAEAARFLHSIIPLEAIQSKDVGATAATIDLLVGLGYAGSDVAEMARLGMASSQSAYEVSQVLKLSVPDMIPIEAADEPAKTLISRAIDLVSSSEGFFLVPYLRKAGVTIKVVTEGLSERQLTGVMGVFNREEKVIKLFPQSFAPGAERQGSIIIHEAVHALQRTDPAAYVDVLKTIWGSNPIESLEPAAELAIGAIRREGDLVASKMLGNVESLLQHGEGDISRFFSDVTPMPKIGIALWDDAPLTARWGMIGRKLAGMAPLEDMLRIVDDFNREIIAYWLDAAPELLRRLPPPPLPRLFDPIDGQELLVAAFKAEAGDTIRAGQFIADMKKLTPPEFIEKMSNAVKRRKLALLSKEYLEYVQGKGAVASILLRHQNSNAVEWFQTQFMRYAVLEPARALLVFANYGTFNLLEDMIRVVLGGHGVTPFNPVTYNLVSAGLPDTTRLVGGEMKQLAWSWKLTAEEAEAVPWMLKLPGVKQYAGQVMRFNAMSQRFAGKIRRGFLFTDFIENQRLAAEAAGLYTDPAGMAAVDALKRLRMDDTIRLGARDSVIQAAEAMMVRGEYKAIPSLVDAVMAAVDEDEIANLLAQTAGALMPYQKDTIAAVVRKQGIEAVLGNNGNVLKETLWLDEVERLRKSPAMLEERFTALLKNIRRIADNAAAYDAPQVLAQLDQLTSMITAYFMQPAMQSNVTRTAAVAAAEVGPHWAKHFDVLDTVGANFERQMMEAQDAVRLLESKLGEIKLVGTPKAQKAFADELTQFRGFLDSHTSKLKTYLERYVDINDRFFPERAGGIKQWYKTIDELAKGNLDALSQLPTEMQNVLRRGTDRIVQLDNIKPVFQVASAQNLSREYAPIETILKEIALLGGKARSDAIRGLNLQLQAIFWDSLKEATFSSTQLTQAQMLKELDKAVRGLRRDAVFASNDQTDEILRKLHEAEEAGTTWMASREEVLAANVGLDARRELDQAFSALEELARKKQMFPEEATRLKARLIEISQVLEGVNNDITINLKGSAVANWNNAIEKTKNTFTNYTDTMILDQTMTAVFPFWRYQSRSWPWLAGAALSHPGVATTFLPNGRYWQMTEDGYIPIDIFGLQPMPIRGTVFGRLRRSFRGTFPPMFGGVAGAFERLSDVTERFGFFPGTVWSVVPEGIAGMLKGGDVRYLTALVTENLPTPLSTLIEGGILATGLVPGGAKVTNALAEAIFPSRFRQYYMTKMLYDAYGVSPSQAKELGHEEWVADAYVAVAWRQMIEEHLSLTRVNPESWTAIKDRIDDVVAKETGLTVEEVKIRRQHAQRTGLPVSESLPLSRIQRAQLGLVDGIEALSEAGRVLSPEDKRLYLEARADYYQTLDNARQQNREDQLDADAAFQEALMDAGTWRKDMRKRAQEYRGMARMVESKYFGQIGRTAIEQEAVKAGFGMASSDHPVDTILDGLFAMQPPMAPDGTDDWGALFMAQEEMLSALPPDVREDIKDYLARNWTPLQREFREGSITAVPFFRTEQGIQEWYTKVGRKDVASYVARLYSRQRDLQRAEQRAISTGRALSVVQSRELSAVGKILTAEIRVYRRRLLMDTPNLLSYLQKFYTYELPQWVREG